ncbi:MAG: hypothetical protein QOC71_208 [Thermoplasmata archaeon]|nr:hypothetical protein [Thermoplasmata archaeon]
MTRLRPIPFRKVRKALDRLGFHSVRQTGSHVIFQHADGRLVVLPRHDREDIRVPLLRIMLTQGRIDAKEFMDLV